MPGAVRGGEGLVHVSDIFAGESISGYPKNLPYFVAEIILFAVYLALTGFAVNICLHKPKHTRFKQWTMYLCILMYLISTAHVCISIMSFVYSRRGEPIAEYLPEQIIVLANIAISDIIVIWRAWVLWPRNCWVRVLLGLCIVGDIVGLVVGGLFDLSAGLPGAVASWTTNIITTSLVAWKAWRHHKDVTAHLNAYTGRTRVEKTLLLFIESGLIYALLWSFIVAAYAVTITENPYATVNVILDGMLQYPTIQLVSIYPIATVVLVDYSNSYFNRALIAETVHCHGSAKNDAETPQLETTIDSVYDDEPPVAQSVLTGIRYVAGHQRSTHNDELALTSGFITQTSVAFIQPPHAFCPVDIAAYIQGLRQSNLHYKQRLRAARSMLIAPHTRPWPSRQGFDRKCPSRAIRTQTTVRREAFAPTPRGILAELGVGRRSATGPCRPRTSIVSREPTQGRAGLPQCGLALLSLLTTLLESTARRRSAMEQFPLQDPHFVGHTTLPLLPLLAIKAVYFVLHTVMGVAVWRRIAWHAAKRTRFQLLAIYLCITMYLISAAHLGVCSVWIIGTIRGDLGRPLDLLYPQLILPIINVAISDGLAVGRACVHWPRNRLVLVVLCSIFLGEIVALLKAIVSTSFITDYFVVSSWITKLVTTGLICQRYRSRTNILERRMECTRASRSNLLALTLETGILTLIYWSLAVLWSLLDDASPAILLLFTLEELVSVQPMLIVALADATHGPPARRHEPEGTRAKPVSRPHSPPPSPEIPQEMQLISIDDGCRTPTGETTVHDEYGTDADGVSLRSYVPAGFCYVSSLSRGRSTDQMSLHSAFMTDSGEP